ncbi:hypothetical protein [Chondromyces crocatus]|uniref:Uncharacterized protein n=1 Tax=Chondromyces crocatus TaxID=52 RepID=A0A0K1EMX3_CHOCO|nr:hypothetical protein [Chondromyces crocatus]AKT42194.1 uncharacterized protein CMC5_064170 [Chondromyces crocatus]
MSDAASYPFVFFGVEPADWFSLQQDLFSYELRFASALDGTARRAAAMAWQRALDPDTVELVEPLLWTERWALVRARPAGWSRPCLEAFAQAVAHALRAVHEACPLDQVQLAEVLESDGDWDAWSAALRPEPVPGPAWPIDLPRSGAHARFEARAAVDPEVERALAAMRTEAAEEQPSRSWSVGAADEATGDETGARALLELNIERHEDEPWPGALALRWKPFGSSSHVRMAPDGKVYGVAKKNRSRVGAWLVDDTLCTASGPELPDVSSMTLAARDDGSTALIAIEDEAIWEIDFRDGTQRLLFPIDGRVSGADEIAYGPEGRVLVLADIMLVVYRNDGDTWVLEQGWDVTGYAMCSCLDGRILVMTQWDDDGEECVAVYGFDGPTLRLLARKTVSVGALFSLHGRHLAQGRSERGGRKAGPVTCELVGLSTMLERLEADPGAFAEVARVAVEREDRDAEEDSASDDEDAASDDEDSDDEDSASDDEDSASDDEGDEDQDDEAFAGDPSKDPPFQLIEGDLQFEARKREELPSRPQPSVDVRRLFSRPLALEVAPDGRPFGIVRPLRKAIAFAWLEGDEVRLADLEGVWSSEYHLAARPDSATALVAVDSGAVYELEFAAGKVRQLFEFDGWMSTVACGPEGRILLLSSDSLVVYGPSDEGFVREAEWDVHADDLKTFFDGRIVMTFADAGNDAPSLRILGFDGATLRSLASLQCEEDVSIADVVPSGDRLFVRVSGEPVRTGSYARGYEILHPEALLERLATDPRSYPEVAVTDRAKDENDDDDDENDDESQDDDDDTPAAPPKQPEDFVIEPPAGHPGLRYLGKKSPLPRGKTIPKPVRAMFGTGARDVTDIDKESDSCWGWKKEAKRSFRFCVAKDGQLFETALVTPHPSNAVVNWDQTHALVQTDDDTKLWRVGIHSNDMVLVRDFGEDQEEVNFCEPLADGWVLVATHSEGYLFTVRDTVSELRMRGGLDCFDMKSACKGRVVAAAVSGEKSILLWGIYEDGPRILGEFELPLFEFQRSEGRLFIDASPLGWYELTQMAEAWEAAGRDLSGDRFPKLSLKRTEEDEGDDEGDDEDESGAEEEDGDEDEAEGEDDEDEDEDE